MDSPLVRGGLLRLRRYHLPDKLQFVALQKDPRGIASGVKSSLFQFVHLIPVGAFGGGNGIRFLLIAAHHIGSQFHRQ